MTAFDYKTPIKEKKKDAVTIGTPNQPNVGAGAVAPNPSVGKGTTNNSTSQEHDQENNEKSADTPDIRKSKRTPYDYEAFPRGFVSPYIASPSAAVWVVEGNAQHGFQNFKQATEWARTNLVRTYSNQETGGKGAVEVSNSTIGKFLSKSATNKSASIAAHLSALKVLPELLRESIEAEIHPDFKKVDGERSPKNGYNKDTLTHRWYGALAIDGNLYRVKITVNETLSEQKNRAHSYEASKIELLETKPTTLSDSLFEHNELPSGTLSNDNASVVPTPRPSNSISAAKLLQNVDMSYNSGRKLLDEAQKNLRHRNFTPEGIVGENEQERERLRYYQRGRALQAALEDRGLRTSLEKAYTTNSVYLYCEGVKFRLSDHAQNWDKILRGERKESIALDVDAPIEEQVNRIAENVKYYRSERAEQKQREAEQRQKEQEQRHALAESLWQKMKDEFQGGSWWQAKKDVQTEFCAKTLPTAVAVVSVGGNVEWYAQESDRSAIEKLFDGHHHEVGLAVENGNRPSDSAVFELDRKSTTGKNSTLRKRIGEKRKAQMKAGMLTKLTMMSEADIDRNIAEIERLGEQYKQAGKDGNPKLEKAAYQWLLNGVLRLPDDNYKILDALSVAEKLHIDPLAYESPMELMAQHSDTKPSLRKTDPDTVPQFSDKRELPYGVVTYEVEDTKEGQAAVRRVIDEHFGTDANPWCLAARNADAWYYWHEVYTSYPKRIVFQNGKLIAFSANNDTEPCYWDRQDEPHDGIPVTTEGLHEGEYADWEMDEEGECVRLIREYSGNKQNGLYVEWDGMGRRIEEHYKKGKLNGERREYDAGGDIRLLENYVNGKLEGVRYEYYEGNVVLEEHYKNGFLDGVVRAYNYALKLKKEKHYVRGHEEGLQKEMNHRGHICIYIADSGDPKEGVVPNFYTLKKYYLDFAEVTKEEFEDAKRKGRLSQELIDAYKEEERKATEATDEESADTPTLRKSKSIAKDSHIRYSKILPSEAISLSLPPKSKISKQERVALSQSIFQQIAEQSAKGRTHFYGKAYSANYCCTFIANDFQTAIVTNLFLIKDNEEQVKQLTQNNDKNRRRFGASIKRHRRRFGDDNNRLSASQNREEGTENVRTTANPRGRVADDERVRLGGHNHQIDAPNQASTKSPSANGVEEDTATLRKRKIDPTKSDLVTAALVANCHKSFAVKQSAIRKVSADLQGIEPNFPFLAQSGSTLQGLPTKDDELESSAIDERQRQRNGQNADRGADDYQQRPTKSALRRSKRPNARANQRENGCSIGRIK